MAISSISLTASTRKNLGALQKTASQLSTTEERLATGKKVNSSSDDSSSYFAAQGFMNKASDLSTLKNGLATNLQIVSAASSTIDSVTSLVSQLQSVVTSALQTTDTTSRANYATSYNSLMTQLDYMVTDSTFNGTNLLDASSNLTVYFNEKNTTMVTVSGVNATSAGLGIKVAQNSFAATSDIQVAQSLLQTAMTTLRTDSSSFGSATTVISTRQSFTDSMISSLQTASDNLILADTNEESANLSTLQTRNQLAVVSLGISTSTQSTIMRLF